jgi:ribonuclease HII
MKTTGSDIKKTITLEEKRSKKFPWIIGIDEVGRGPIAGPVTVCAFAIRQINVQKFSRFAKKIGITDSKKLTEKKRTELSNILCTIQINSECDFSISMTSATIIDRQGISRAIKMALQKSLDDVCTRQKISPDQVFVFLDGSLYAPTEYGHQETIIKGDGLIPVISAASILAKVHRDRYMAAMAKKYPGYAWEQNKGYGTKLHYQGIKKQGITKLHRKSFLG